MNQQIQKRQNKTHLFAKNIDINETKQHRVEQQTKRMKYTHMHARKKNNTHNISVYK